MRKIVTIIFAGLFLFWSEGGLCANEPQQKFNGFNLQGYNESGEKAWNVNGDTADIVGSEIILSNVDATTYGDQKMNVTAKTGTVDQLSGKMHLEQDVVITSEDGKKLTTNSLDWNREEDLVTTDDDVTITDTDARMMATGTGMKARPGLKTTELKEDVTIMIETEPEESDVSTMLTITSDGPMTIDQIKSVAVFVDNVVAVQTDRTLKADRMEVYFDQEMTGIKKMICSGNVKIEQGENKSYAQMAVYTASDKKLTLSGRPKLILLTEGEGLFAASGN